MRKITGRLRFAAVSATAIAAATLIPGSAAFAQDATSVEDGNEIVVTATKRSDTIQNVPFSINAQTAAAMQRNGATNIEDISRSVAGLTVQNFGPGQSQVAIRGVSAGQIARDQPGVKEQVGVYLDETVISLSLFTPDFDLFDLNRVETLRGPQGTLFGSGSEGGTVRYITNQPKLGKTEGTVEAGVNVLKGGDVGYSGKAVVNLPVSDTLAIRAVGYGEHFGGFINAIGPAAGKNINDGRRYGGRLAVLWEPAPGIKVTPRIIYQDIKTNGFNREDVYNLYYNPLISSSDVIPERTQYLKLREGFRDKTTLADLNISADVADNVSLTSVTSYVHRDVLVTRDASALTGSVYVSFAGADPAAAGGAALNSTLLDATKLKQFTQELRLASSGGAPFQWVFGGFYSHVDRTYTQRLPTPGADVYSQIFLDAAAPGVTVADVSNGYGPDSPYNADIPYVIKQTAVFGEASYKIDKFKLTAGGRYYDFSETSDFKTGGIFANGDNQLNRKTSSHGFTPRFIASYEASKDVTLNLQASKGFRLGGVNDNLLQNLCTASDLTTYGGHPKFDDETLWNYEGGIKARVGGVTFNASAFHTEIRNLQVTADAGSCSTRVIFNVPKAHSTGLEMELTAKPASGFELALSGSYTDSKFDSTVADGAGNPIAGIRKGNRLPTVPKFQMAASATYTYAVSSDIDWSATASFQHVGDRYTQAVDQEPGSGTFSNSLYYNPATGANGAGAYTFGTYLLPSYNLVNLSTSVAWKNGLSVTLYVNNLFDETPLLALDRERGGRARLGYSIGSARKIGMTIRKDF